MASSIVIALIWPSLPLSRGAVTCLYFLTHPKSIIVG